MSSNRRSKKKKEEIPKPRLKEKVTEVLDLPKEVILDIPKLTMIGNTNLVVENYKGVIEYDVEKIRLNTGIGIIRIGGKELVIKEITSEDIMVYGKIESLEFCT
ncbi:sporulation protein YqfC [Pseudobacteroides cellulosolvens]|uniref:Sporulation protein YqfC n=1 Tax=Pseudobacteroides cellulosolvens ATCC 35603 = DSM 2933 TaxID=398512 RepID=A0A0L6JJ38_9FIRM|nr:sporulation protein YqfC [Pseudobacteroides cellulosolvens]KNY25745.1 sporulation protein YqfC [Pseudobacteroides cellulosolvens ATCC 35603 = DSM 2933]